MDKNQNDNCNLKSDNVSKGRTNMDLDDTPTAAEARENTQKSDAENRNQKSKAK